MTELPERFKKLKQIHLGRHSDDTKTVTVEYVRVEPRGIRLKFIETPDRNGAETLVGSLLFVREEQRIKPKKGSHFIHDVIGLRVIDDEENDLGVVKDVLRFPGQDLYVIESNGREWMIPAVKEFVISIDVSEKTMKVRLIDGLME